jgi:hypothetical protein
MNIQLGIRCRIALYLELMVHKDMGGWYVTCECGFQKRGLSLQDSLLEEEEHAMTHDPDLRLSRPNGGRKTRQEQTIPPQS